MSLASPPLKPLPHWSQSAAGQYALAWQSGCYERLHVDIFGYYALQISALPPGALDALAASRITHRWHARPSLPLLPEAHALDLIAQPQQLPVAENSLDALVLPHVLEESPAPHAALQEAARALIPQGHLLLSGFTRTSLWSLPWNKRTRAALQLPPQHTLQSPTQLAAQLSALGLQVQSLQYGCWQGLHAAGNYPNHAPSERWGRRLYPRLGACYMLHAVKQIVNPRLMPAPWLADIPSPAAQPTAPAALGQVPNHLPATPAK